MATASIIAPSSKYSYFSLSNTTDANGGYNASEENCGYLFVGQSGTSATTPGNYVGVFGILLYDLLNGENPGAIQTITFNIDVTNTGQGYNGCVARIEYIGTAVDNLMPLWRVGSSSEQINLVEDATNTMTTTNITTCTNLANVIGNATSGQYHYFRLVRESGMGAYVSNSATIKLSITYTESSARRSTAYVWGVSNETYTFPETAMTSNSSANCVASASSQYGSDYAAWHAFDKAYSNARGWLSKTSDTSPWLQLQIPIALYNIQIEIRNRTTSSVKGPIAGSVLGSNNGSTWTTLKSFSNFDGSTSGGVSGTISCVNTSTAYKYIRVTFSDWSGSDSVSVGEMYISGAKTPPSGGWLEATPYIWTSSGWKEASSFRFE